MRIAVAAAEQLWKGSEKAGAEKKQYVIEFLKSKGLTVDFEELDAMIEAEVYSLYAEVIA